MDYIQCEDEGNVQSRSFDSELLQRVRLRRTGNVLERANISLGNLLPIVRMGRTRAGRTISKVDQLPNFSPSNLVMRRSVSGLSSGGVAEGACA
jgi:hypothetical protein